MRGPVRGTLLADAWFPPGRRFLRSSCLRGSSVGSVRLQETPQVSDELNEARLETHVKGPRPGIWDALDPDDAARPRAKDDHPIRQEDGFLDAVGDEDRSG